MLLSCSKNVIWRLDSFWWLTLCVLPFHCSEVLQGVRNQLWRGTRHIPEAKMGFALLNGSCNGQTPSALSTLAFREQRVGFWDEYIRLGCAHLAQGAMEWLSLYSADGAIMPCATRCHSYTTYYPRKLLQNETSPQSMSKL